MSASAEFQAEIEKAQKAVKHLTSLPLETLKARDNELGKRLRRGRFKLSFAEKNAIETERVNLKMAMLMLAREGQNE